MRVEVEPYRTRYAWREYGLGYAMTRRLMPDREMAQTYTDIEPEDL